MVETETKIQRYDSYKDSGAAWLGDIPEHWEITRLANIGKFSSSGIDKLIKKNESLVRIINYTDIYKNLEHTINSKMNFMEVTTPETNRIKNLVNKGDLIFLPSSETLEDLGLSALVDEDIENLSFSYHVLRFEFTKEISHKFKKYFTNNQAVLNEFSKKGTGSIRKTLGRNDFRNTIVVLPPLPEQTAIAQFLDDKTTKIDAAIAIKQQQVALLKERKQILIHKAVTKGVTSSAAEMKDSGVEWIGEIPEHWDSITFRRVSRLQQGLQISIDKRLEEPTEGALEYITTKSIHNPKDPKHYVMKPNQNVVCNTDDVLLGRTGNTGEVVTNVSGVFHNNFFKIVYERKKIYRDFLVAYLNINGIQNAIMLVAGVTTIPDLNHGAFLGLPFLCPPLSEQKEIANYIETASAKIETAMSLKEQEIEKLQEYKSSLINSVVTGKVRVC